VSAPLLSVRGLGKRFGGFVALDGVDLSVPKGQRLGLIGPNGSGKSTLVNCICIEVEGRSTAGLSPDRVCRLGVGRTFQIVKPFPALTVRENLRTAAMFGRAAMPNAAAADRSTEAVLDALGLADAADEPAGTLTLSGQKRLEIARAVATGARLVLLDEVMAGLTPTEVAQMLETLRRLRASHGLTLLVIEHVMRALMDLCARIVVLHHGECIAIGTPVEIGADPRVLSAYLGSSV